MPEIVKKEYPRLMLIRPSQLRAVVEDFGLYAAVHGHACAVIPPAAGREDIIVRSEQALELQKKMPHATVRLVPEAGHMVHYFVADEIFETAEVKQMEAA